MSRPLASVAASLLVALTVGLTGGPYWAAAGLMVMTFVLSLEEGR